VNIALYGGANNASALAVCFATRKGRCSRHRKNLVEIILKNNGYDVVNLGIKVPPEDLIKAYQQHKPDAIGLSGLLVKSAQQMVITATICATPGSNSAAGRWGGALREIHADEDRAGYGKAVCYAKDAMTGLRLMNELMDPATRTRWSALTRHQATELAS